MVARLQCWRVSNLLRFGGATSLTMTMAVHQQSPEILDTGKTVMARLHSNLFNNCGKTAIPARQQWRWQRVENLLEFLTAVTLQCKRIGNLLDNDGMGCVGVLLDSMLFVGR